MSGYVPASQGALHVYTESVPGVWVGPSGDGAGLAISNLKAAPAPVIAEPRVLNDTTVMASPGGGWSVVNSARCETGAFEVSVSHIDASRSVDFLPLLRACPLREDEPVVADGVAVRFRPAVAYGVAGASPQTGTPKTCAITWRDAGDPTRALVYRMQRCVCALTGIAVGADNDLRMTFEAWGAPHRGAGGELREWVQSASVLGMTEPPTYQDELEHPIQGAQGAELALDGGAGEWAEALVGTFVTDVAFASSMSATEVPCRTEVDGFGVSFVDWQGKPAITVTVIQTGEDESDPKGPFAALLTDAAYVESVELRWRRVNGAVTWTFLMGLGRSQVVAVERGEEGGARTLSVTLASRGHEAFWLQLQRTVEE